jgi:hypothetical protein
MQAAGELQPPCVVPRTHDPLAFIVQVFRRQAGPIVIQRSVIAVRARFRATTLLKVLIEGSKGQRHRSVQRDANLPVERSKRSGRSGVRKRKPGLDNRDVPGAGTYVLKLTATSSVSQLSGSGTVTIAVVPALTTSAGVYYITTFSPSPGIILYDANPNDAKSAAIISAYVSTFIALSFYVAFTSSSLTYGYD